MKCVRCGKDIVEYKEKRTYWSPKSRGYIIEHICKECYVDLDKIEGNISQININQE